MARQLQEKGGDCVRVAKDLGTYYLRVELSDGRGWIERWNTCARYTDGTFHVTHLTAQRISPLWDDEQEIFHGMMFKMLENSCDGDFEGKLAAAQQEDAPEHICSDHLIVQRLTAIRPDGTEAVLYAGALKA
jgi:hypothetical protein